MRHGGNAALNRFLESHGVRKDTPIAVKYATPAAALYREVVVARVEGKPIPTELPRTVSAPGSAHGGLEPLPGE